MTITIKSTDELVGAVRASTPQLIAVDGMLGSGKSTLARDLSRVLGCTLIACDEYLRRGEETYLEALQYEALRSTLNHARTVANGKTVLEGVCLRAVMRRLDIDPDHAVVIYVKRVSPQGDWVDADELESMQPSMRAAVRDLCGEDYVTPAARREVREYHRSDRPDAAADIIFERITEDA